MVSACKYTVHTQILPRIHIYQSLDIGRNICSLFVQAVLLISYYGNNFLGEETVRRKYIKVIVYYWIQIFIKGEGRKSYRDFLVGISVKQSFKILREGSVRNGTLHFTCEYFLYVLLVQCTTFFTFFENFDKLDPIKKTYSLTQLPKRSISQTLLYQYFFMHREIMDKTEKYEENIYLILSTVIQYNLTTCR